MVDVAVSIRRVDVVKSPHRSIMRRRTGIIGYT
jgi:hypothetical protein